MMETELQKIYDSEINVEISWLWDGGIDVKLGDAMNGYRAETNVNTLAEVIPWLQRAIARYYPDSAYAKSLGAEIHPLEDAHSSKEKDQARSGSRMKLAERDMLEVWLRRRG